LTDRVGWCQTTPAAGPDAAARSIASAQGKLVRVTNVDGTTLAGRLQSTTPAGLIIRTGSTEVNVPLSCVRRVEKVAHGVWWGLVSGAVAGFVYGYGVADADAGEVMIGAFIAGIGAAGGAGIGAMVDHARRNGNVVYDSGSRSARAAIAPTVGRGRAGVALTVGWSHRTASTPVPVYFFCCCRGSSAGLT